MASVGHLAHTLARHYIAIRYNIKSINGWREYHWLFHISSLRTIRSWCCCVGSRKNGKWKDLKGFDLLPPYSLQKVLTPFSGVCATVAFCGIRSDRKTFAPHVHQWTCCWSTGCSSSDRFWLLLITAYQEHDTPFGDALTQSSSHNSSAVVKALLLILMLARFPCFKNWLFTCCLIYLAPWQVPL